MNRRNLIGMAPTETRYSGPATLEIKGGDRADLKDMSERVDRLLGGMVLDSLI